MVRRHLRRRRPPALSVPALSVPGLRVPTLSVPALTTLAFVSPYVRALCLASNDPRWSGFAQRLAHPSGGDFQWPRPGGIHSPG